MSMKRVVLLVGAAIAAIAFAVPATASATTGTWTINTQKFDDDATVELTGGVQFEVASLGSYGCGFHVEATLTESWGKKLGVKTGKGHLNKFTITTDFCGGTGLLEDCLLSKHSITGLPAALTATKTDLDVASAITIDTEFTNCPASEAKITIPSLTLEPDNALKAKSLEISGNGTTHAFGFPLTTTVSGTLEFGTGSSGKYGVHEQKKEEEEEEEETEETEAR